MQVAPIDPVTIINHAKDFLLTLLAPMGGLAALVGVVCYGYGKSADEPGAVRWAKNAWLGAVVLFAGQPIMGLVKYVADHLFAGTG